MKPLVWVFRAAAVAAAWVLVGYPLSLSASRRRRWRRDADARPSVSILVPGYHEREALPAKLRALERLDYPADLVEIVVAVDGDRELAALAERAAPDATVLFSEERAGKAAGLNRALDRARGEIVVMTDANNLLDEGALRAAVAHFADPEIWAVAGRRGEAGSAYDRYEDLIRSAESRSGSVAAMSGEFMAVRAERMPRFPTGVVNDDFWLLCTLVREGGRVVYEPGARSQEPPPTVGGEIARRSRMGAGRVMALGELGGLPPGYLLRVMSHKLGRLALPFLLLACLVSSLALGRRRGSYRALALAQLAAYGGGGLGALGIAPAGPAGRLLRGLGQFTLGNVAVGLGVIRGLRGRQSAVWERVD